MGSWSVEEIMALLRTTVDRVPDLVAGATAAELAPTPYDAEAWSLAAVMAHLRACNDVLGGAMVRILREDHPSWRAGSPRAWQVKSGYHQLAFNELFAAFAKDRSELLAALDGVSAADWDRTATVAVPPNRRDERSVRYYGEWLAQHEGTHLKDMARRRAARGT
ncbi:MAG TPA: DinB family protein [Candidatus Limnocylindrales bacterium]|nr:DinB family protein [Candidatus Limnocylindrales bacterium]